MLNIHQYQIDCVPDFDGSHVSHAVNALSVVVVKYFPSLQVERQGKTWNKQFVTVH